MLRGLIKGDNAFVPTAALRVAVRSGVDVAALLVTEQGRVRGDADIVFHGAPAHVSGAVRLSGGADGDEEGTVWLDADLPGVEERIARLLVVASTEEGALRDARGLSVEVFGPDGATIVAYEVTDAGPETAMVVAELYRRSGGWKFRAVGQGYADGLTGLAVDHGVDPDGEPQDAVEQPAPQAPSAAPAPLRRPTRDELLDMTEEQIRALAEAHAQARAQAGAQTPPPAAPEPEPRPDPSAWTCGPVFTPRTATGRDNDVITENGLPPGPVMVELTVTGPGYTGLWPLDDSNTKRSSIVSSTETDFRGRVITSVPGHGRLRLRLEADGPWKLRILPLAEARRLSESRLESRGPDVLLHTGGTADAVFRYKGSSNFIVYLYRLAGHTDPTRLPKSGGSAVNEIGARKETLPLPEGPVLVCLTSADGPWDVRLKDVSLHSGGQEAEPAAKLPAPRGARAWLRRVRG
ncbi:TerD family protein [Streptomyces sp. NPDC057854]|uniref:TerD family protein n=1 Tax=unclassified Streptomyces TaxID=2593676 RepID=UPI0036C78F88